MLIPQRIHLRPLLGRIVILRDLIDREITNVGCGLEVGFERGADTAELVPGHAAEEGMGFYILGAVLAALGTEAVGYVAEHAGVSF